MLVVEIGWVGCLALALALQLIGRETADCFNVV